MFRPEWKEFLFLILFILKQASHASVLTCTRSCRIPSAWQRVAKNVCRGTQNDAFGTLRINRYFELVAVRLEHVSGYQTNWENLPTRWGFQLSDKTNFCTLILKDKKLWYPDKIGAKYGSGHLKGFEVMDDVIFFKKNETLAASTALQIAYGWLCEST